MTPEEIDIYDDLTANSGTLYRTSANHQIYTLAAVGLMACILTEKPVSSYSEIEIIEIISNHIQENK